MTIGNFYLLGVYYYFICTSDHLRTLGRTVSQFISEHCPEDTVRAPLTHKSSLGNLFFLPGE